MIQSKYISLMTFVFLYLSAGHTNIYQPTMETSLKAGNQRVISRPSILLPLYETNSKSLLYATGIGMFDSKDNQELNLGLGYRELLNHWIIGGYGYYDLRSTSFHTIAHQVTLGLEALHEKYELRANVYLPLVNTKIIKQEHRMKPKVRGGSIWIDAITDSSVAKTMAGFDVEAGFHVPKFTNIRLFGGFYRYSGKNIVTIQGARIRLDIKLSNYISLEAESQYDKVRKHSYYLGGRITIPLGSKDIKNNLTVLEQKMTQMPVRDIDIVVGILEQSQTVDGTQIINIETKEELTSIGSAERPLSGFYMLPPELDVGRYDENGEIIPDEHSLIQSDKDNPFTGMLLGYMVIENGEISSIPGSKILNMNIWSDERSMGFIGLTKGTQEQPVIIQNIHLNNGRVSLKTNSFPGSYVGGLVGWTEYTNVINTSANITVVVNDSTSGGLIGYALDGTKLYNAHATGDVSGNGNSGGLIGESVNVYICNSYASGNVSGNGSINGGLVARATRTQIIDSHASGNIVCDSNDIGGLVGWAIESQIYNSYAIGNITANGFYVGGLLGRATYNTTIHNSYGNGDIVGDGRCRGGLVGMILNTQIHNCYASGQVSGAASIGMLVGKVQSDCQLHNSFSKHNNNAAIVIPIIGTGNANMGTQHIYSFMILNNGNIVLRDRGGVIETDITTMQQFIGAMGCLTKTNPLGHKGHPNYVKNNVSPFHRYWGVNSDTQLPQFTKAIKTLQYQCGDAVGIAMNSNTLCYRDATGRRYPYIVEYSRNTFETGKPNFESIGIVDVMNIQIMSGFKNTEPAWQMIQQRMHPDREQEEQEWPGNSIYLQQHKLLENILCVPQNIYNRDIRDILDR